MVRQLKEAVGGGKSKEEGGDEVMGKAGDGGGQQGR